MEESAVTKPSLLSRRNSRRQSVSAQIPLSKSFVMAGSFHGNLPSTPEQSSSGSPPTKALSMRDRSNSIARTSSSRGTKLKRRITKIDPNVTISDITRTTRITESEKRKLAPINRRDIFKFECEGEITGSPVFKGKHVQWKATFDRPIEELIYPSLQRFDNEVYEEKKKRHESLHGHSTFVRSPGNTILDNGRGTKMEMLSDKPDTIDGETLVFMHTPKWTMKLEDSARPPRSPKKSPGHSPSAQKGMVNNDSQLDQTFSLDGGDSLTLSLVDEELPGSPSRLKKYATLGMEIEEEGEKCLREEVLERYERRLEEEARLEKIKAETGSFFHISLPHSKRAMIGSTLPPLQEGDADHLVSPIQLSNLNLFHLAIFQSQPVHVAESTR